MGIEQLVLKLISLVLALSLGDHAALIDEIKSAEIELQEMAIRIEMNGPEASGLEYHDHAWFDGNTLVFYPPENEDAAYTIPEGTVAIMPSAFHDNSSIRQVICPDSLIYIGSEAFAQTPLSKIDLDHVLFIGSSAFEGTGLSAITFSDQIVWLDSFAFFGARIKRNTHVTLPSTLIYIGDDIIVSGNSAWDTYEPIYEVIEGSYAHEWATESDCKYILTRTK